MKLEKSNMLDIGFTKSAGSFFVYHNFILFLNISSVGALSISVGINWKIFAIIKFCESVNNKFSWNILSRKHPKINDMCLVIKLNSFLQASSVIAPLIIQYLCSLFYFMFIALNIHGFYIYIYIYICIYVL